MVRRWSYLEKQNSNVKLSTVYFKKSFKSTVRFKRFSVRLTKLTRKKFTSRKIINSHCNFSLYAFSWSKSYKLLAKSTKLDQINNFFWVKSISAQNSRQSWSVSIINSLRFGISFNSLHINSGYHTQPLLFGDNFAFTKALDANTTYLMLNQISKITCFASLLRRILTIKVLKSIL